MKSKKHLLILANTNRLQRWEETFTNSLTMNIDTMTKNDADIVWLRLNPNQNAFAQIQAVKAVFNAPLVVMTAIPNLNEAMLAINMGARAYINCHAGPNNLNQVVNVIENNGIWVGEDLMQLLTKSIAEKQSKDGLTSHWQTKLSDREIEVVNAVVKGLPNKLIARELNITERTVKAHLTAVFEKLKVSDRIKLVLLVTSEKV